MSAQVIKCKCGKVYAACAEPECYEDAGWQKDMRKYVKRGHTVEMLQNGEWKFEPCTCEGKQLKIPTSNQLQLL